MIGAGAARRLVCVCLLVAVLTVAGMAGAQSLAAQVDDSRLRIAVRDFHLLKGGTLERLKDGASINYNVQLSALGSRSGNVLAKVEYRFAISFDIFEERFQVTRLQPSSRVASHLSLAAAEAACLEGFELPVQVFDAAKPFWLRLEYNAEEPSKDNNPRAKLGVLIEVFSKKNAEGPIRGSFEGGPFQLKDLPKFAAPRGADGK